MNNTFKGRIKTRGCDTKGYCYAVVEYTDKDGVCCQKSTYLGAKRVDVGDLVRCSIEEGRDGKTNISIQIPLFGCVVNRVGDVTWIRAQDEKQYPCYEPLEDGAQYVSFYTEAGSNGQERAVDVMVKRIPAELLAVDEDDETDEGEKQKQSGVVLDHCWGKFITIQGERRMRFYCEDYAVEKWFFAGDRVSFDTAPNKKIPSYTDAINVKKLAGAPAQVWDIDGLREELRQAGEAIASPFAADRFPNDFQKQILRADERFRQKARRFLGVWFPTTIRFSSNHSREQVFSNITGELHPSDEYYTTPLARLKPFFDPLVPYLYACSIRQEPTHLPAILQDYCGFLNTVQRAQRYCDAGCMQVDADGYFYQMLAQLVRHLVIKQGASLDAETKMDLLLALSGRPCWQEEDSMALLSCGEEDGHALCALYGRGTEADEACVQQLAAASPRALGKCCDLILHRAEAVTEISEGFLHLLSSVLALGGREALCAFLTVERHENEALLRNAYETVVTLSVAEEIGETARGRMAALAVYMAQNGLAPKGDAVQAAGTDEPFSPEAILADPAERRRFSDCVIAEF